MKKGQHKRGMARGSAMHVETSGHDGAHASHHSMNKAHGTPHGFGAPPKGYGAGHTGKVQDCSEDHVNSMTEDDYD